MKKTTKKVIASALATITLLGLASCGSKAVTAESLLEGFQPTDKTKYYNTTMVVDVKAQANAEESSLKLETGIEGKGDIIHMYDTKMTMSESGMDLSLDMEVWVDAATGVSYEKMSAFGFDSGWALADSEDGLALAPDDMLSITNDLLKTDMTGTDLARQPHEKGQDYVVTWTVQDESLNEAMKSILSSYAELSSEETDGEVADPVATTTATFDEETKDLKSVVVSLTSAEDTGAPAATISFVFNERNSDKQLTIPQDVVDEANAAAAEIDDAVIESEKDNEEVAAQGFEQSPTEQGPSEEDSQWLDGMEEFSDISSGDGFEFDAENLPVEIDGFVESAEAVNP